jgi:hypothetical protein
MDGQGWNLGKDKIFLFYAAFRPAMRPTEPLIQWVQGVLSPGAKRTGFEAN